MKDCRERLLYHQIHPLELSTDVATPAVVSVLLWHHCWLAMLVGFVPSIVVTILLARRVDLEPYRRSAVGRHAHAVGPSK